MDTNEKSSINGAELVETIKSSTCTDDGLQQNFDNLSDEEIVALEKRVVRKVDLHLITSLFVLFIFNILDRTNIASARLGGLEEDLNLTESQFQTCVSILYVGYLVGQVPSNIILTRAKPSIYLPCAMLAWGSISLCTTATQNFAGLLTIRLLLGFAESPFFSGALLLVSSWYKPREMAPRVAFLYCGNTIANGFGGLLAAGVLDGLDNVQGLRGWRWLYIVEGGATVLVGFLAFFLLPDFPNSGTTRWLTEQEQRFAHHRLALAGDDELDVNGSIKDGLKAAVTDVKVWSLVFIQICLLSSQTWVHFFPTIVNTLGYSRTVTLLLTAPVYFFGFLSALGNACLAQYTNKRAVLVMWPLVLGIVGNIMVVTSTVVGVRFTGMFLMCAGSYSSFDVIQAWIGSTIPRTRTKRAVAYAMVNMFGNMSNTYGAYFFPDASAPQFVPGGIALSSFSLGAFVAAGLFGLYLRHLNKKATELENEDGVARYKFLY